MYILNFLFVISHEQNIEQTLSFILAKVVHLHNKIIHIQVSRLLNSSSSTPPQLPYDNFFDSLLDVLAN